MQVGVGGHKGAQPGTTRAIAGVVRYRTKRYNPPIPGTRHPLAATMLLQRQPEKAIEICGGVLERKPGIWATLDTGALLARAGDLRSAQSCVPAGLPKQPPAEAPLSLPKGAAKELLEWPIYWRRILRLWAEIALATGRPQTALSLLQAAPPSEVSQEWPDAPVRASIASGERKTAERLLASLFRNPAAYWIAPDASWPGFIRQAITQAKIMPACRCGAHGLCPPGCAVSRGRPAPENGCCR